MIGKLFGAAGVAGALYVAWGAIPGHWLQQRMWYETCLPHHGEDMCAQELGAPISYKFGYTYDRINFNCVLRGNRESDEEWHEQLRQNHCSNAD